MRLGLKMILYEYLDSDLSFRHSRIIIDEGRDEAKQKFKQRVIKKHKDTEPGKGLSSKRSQDLSPCAGSCNPLSIVSALLFFVGKWSSVSKHSLGKDVI